MPAIITHRIFGEDASSLLPEDTFPSQEALLAFLLGNQGPDPLLARGCALPRVATSCHRFAQRMHEERVLASFAALRDATLRLSEEDRPIGHAFALGMLAHYLLDSFCHPLVLAQLDQLCQADPTLNEARPEVHALIEADIDSWMLWQKRQQTVLEYPCAGALAHTKRITRIAGLMLAEVARSVYGMSIDISDYAASLRDYAFIYRLIDPPASKIKPAVVAIEGALRPYSRAMAQTHRVITNDSCPFGNLEHGIWYDSATDSNSTASIADLFHDALLAWPALAEVFALGNQEKLETMAAHINYYGMREA